MLEIQERFDTFGYEKLSDLVGSVQLHITEAVDKGEVIGYIAYSYENDRTVVYDYDAGGDLLLCDGLVRSVIFKSCLKGISKAEYRLDDKEKYSDLRRLSFLESDSTTAEDLDRFMNGCKDCKHSEE